MSLLGDSYQYQETIQVNRHGNWVFISDDFGSFIPMPYQRYHHIVEKVFYLRLCADFPPSDETYNKAVRMYCKEFAYEYCCLN